MSDLPDWAVDTVRDEPPLIDRKRAAQILGCSLRTIDRLARSGRLRVIRNADSGSSRVRIPRLLLAEYIANRALS